MESNNYKKKFGVVVGGRPNFIKAASFFREAKNHPEFSFDLIHTGQHYDQNMSGVFFDELKIPRPKFNLGISGGFHTEKLGRMFSGLKKLINENKYDGVIIFGDINSTLAGGIASSSNGSRLVHIEAGLRSYDRRMPEEMNRVIVDHLSDMLFITEPSAKENLKKEGIEEEKIHYVGNLMIETLESFLPKISVVPIVESLGLSSKRYIIATLHREENTNNELHLAKILNLLRDVSKELKVVFPLHPGTGQDIKKYKLEHLLKDIFVVEPLGYFEFIKLMMESRGVITDSGGVQEEASHLGIPCCTVRDNTERPITLERGSNKLFPLDSLSVDEVRAHISRKDFTSKNIPLWDTKVAERIFKQLKISFS